MSARRAGQKVLVHAEVVDHREGVGVRVETFSKTDQYQAWVREDLVTTAGVVLDFGPGNLPARTALEYVREVEGRFVNESSEAKFFGWLADQIESQTESPMDEPGRYAIVRDRAGENWVNSGPNRAGFPKWINLDTGLRADWDEIVAPTPVRPGEDES